MSDATSDIVIDPAAGGIEQGELEKTNVQKRIDELTAEKYAYAKQIEQLTSTVGDLIKKTAVPAAAPVQAEPSLPEGLDPSIAKWMVSTMKAEREEMQKSTQQLFWQVQHQMNEQSVAQRYAGTPPEVLADAAKRLTGLQQRYGAAANMDDAIKFALGEQAMKAMAGGRATQYNAMNPAMAAQSGMALVSGQNASSSNLVPPSQRADWARLDIKTQNALITEYEKKGGELF